MSLKYEPASVPQHITPHPKQVTHAAHKLNDTLFFFFFITLELRVE